MSFSGTHSWGFSWKPHHYQDELVYDSFDGPVYQINHDYLNPIYYAPRRRHFLIIPNPQEHPMLKSQSGQPVMSNPEILYLWGEHSDIWGGEYRLSDAGIIWALPPGCREAPTCEELQSRFLHLAILWLNANFAATGLGSWKYECVSGQPPIGDRAAIQGVFQVDYAIERKVREVKQLLQRTQTPGVKAPYIKEAA